MSLWTWLFGEREFKEKYPTGRSRGEKPRTVKTTPPKPVSVVVRQEFGTPEDPVTVERPIEDTPLVGEPLREFSSPPQEIPTYGDWPTGVVIAFLRECEKQGVRITYAGLSLLRIPQGTSLNRGRHGANLVKRLPDDLQILVCRTTGTYHDRAIEKYGEERVALYEKDPVIPPSSVLKAFEAFKASQAV